MIHRSSEISSILFPDSIFLKWRGDMFLHLFQNSSLNFSGTDFQYFLFSYGTPIQLIIYSQNYIWRPTKKQKVLNVYLKLLNVYLKLSKIFHLTLRSFSGIWSLASCCLIGIVKMNWRNISKKKCEIL